MKCWIRLSGERYERLFLEIRRPERLTLEQRMVPGKKCGQLSAGEDRLDLDALIGLSLVEEADIELAAPQTRHLLRSQHVRYAGLRLRFVVVERVQESQQTLDREQRNTADS